MKKLLLLTLLCFSINGFAFNWKKVGENKIGDSYYVDVDSIKKHNGFVYYWELVDFLEPSSKGVFSFIMKWKHDCRENPRDLTKILDLTVYSQQMGREKIIVERSKIRFNGIYLKPESLYFRSSEKFACGYVK